MALVAVTDTGGLDFGPGIAALRAAGHRVELIGADSAVDVRDRAEHAEALIVSFVGIDAATIAALSRLRVVATTTVGLDQVDVAAARAAGVQVCGLPPLASEEVATHALAGILAMTRELAAGQAAAADWDFTRIPAPPRLSELTLGLYGMGQIAQHLAVRARPMFGRIVALDPYVPAEEWPAGVDRVDSADQLFATSNVLSLHAPSTPQTRHAVDARALALMPPDGYVVNVARGELVDAAAVLTALDSGHLRGAFLDVADPEPPDPADPLLSHPRTIVTPHAGFYSGASERAYVMGAVANVLAALTPTSAPLTTATPGGADLQETL
ncbi:NAD(P)-dependent oxidoreductase [Nocardioides kongjuensis]|uniref:D-3-phosphoglycerate dehydrogenase n=1 Tax=Nocardioides kongjuensis TaxID=349522 RepID=A0A852R6G9_9ACTN|nr:NAD(P)-dependent oxidoreductase [Nocardioides kongjuensis]NYD29181.1 D-3-phosphoglycerate dehydrogenase [Nocardioides kongjuensis]